MSLRQYEHSKKYSKEDLEKDLKKTTLKIKPSWTLLGEGSFGSVYKIFLSDDTAIVVKQIKLKYDDNIISKAIYNAGMSLIMPLKKKTNKDDTINRLNREYNNGMLMSNNNIGPTIHDGYNVIYDDVICSYIFMDYYEGSVLELFNKNTVIYMNAIKHMIDLLYKQIYVTKLYCVDIKPENYVYRTDKKYYDIRMIDFDPFFCKTETELDNSLFSYTTIIKNYNINGEDLIFFTNMIQLFIFILKINIYINLIRKNEVSVTNSMYSDFFVQKSFTKILDRDDAVNILTDAFKNNSLLYDYVLRNIALNIDSTIIFEDYSKLSEIIIHVIKTIRNNEPLNIKELFKMNKSKLKNWALQFVKEISIGIIAGKLISKAIDKAIDKLTHKSDKPIHKKKHNFSKKMYKKRTSKKSIRKHKRRSAKK